MKELELTKQDIVPGIRLMAKVDGSTYVITHVARETVVFEDENQTEGTATIVWVLENWMKERVPAESWVWYCVTCKAFERKIYEAALKKCNHCQTNMKPIYLIEAPTDDLVYQEFRKQTDDFYYYLLDVLERDDAIRKQVLTEVDQFLREIRRKWRKKVLNTGSPNLRTTI